MCNPTHKIMKTPTQHLKKALMWYKVKELNSKGFRENKNASNNWGGDKDFIMIDKLLKQWCWWENGFSEPFDKTQKDKTKDLYYYAKGAR